VLLNGQKPPLEIALMKVACLNRMSLAAAVLLASSATLAQSPTPAADASALSEITSQQSAQASDRVAKAHARAGTAARSVLGLSADSMNPDELEAQLADRIPGFAGWVHREDGSSVMRMARIAAVAPGGAASTQSAAASAALERMPAAAAFARSMGLGVRVQPALWDSRQLLTFKDKVFAQAAVKGVIATSIDREANRVEVTYNADLDAAAIDALSDKLVASGIPRSAIVLKPGELPVARATTGVSVRSQPLPLAAGAQFNFNTTEGGFVCSVGVPAVRGGVRGFVTASHCSQSVYNVSASTSTTAPNGTFVGRETVDPSGFACSLPDTLGCRESDALFVSGGPANAVDFGRVLITRSNSLTVAGTIPVTGSVNFPAVGQRVYKTGRTTGTQTGRVARVCVNTLVSNGASGTYGALCSVEVDSSTFSDGGDSGSSIWQYDGTGAVINGILSYGNSTSTGYSAWGGVTKELGALTIR
jgi:hypothetical protein